MFEESGLKIAMGNAEEMLKQRADYVTSSNRHDGAAEAIEKYILSKVASIVGSGFRRQFFIA